MARIVHYPVRDRNRQAGATARGICKAVLRSTAMLAVVFADDGCAVIHHLHGVGGSRRTHLTSQRRQPTPLKLAAGR